MGWQQTYSWSVGIVMGMDLFLGCRQGYGSKPIAGMWVMGCHWILFWDAANGMAMDLFLECGQQGSNGPILSMWAEGCGQ